MRELDKVIGYENVKEELYKILDIIHNPQKYKALGVSAPKGILLDGKPGIGKTLLAKSFIADSGLNAVTVRKDRPDGDFVDYIRESFEKAVKKAPSIILLDDMDKFANEDDYHRNAEEYVTVQACIDEVKGKDVYIIATCNRMRSLPESLYRTGRFDKIFHMSFPLGEDAQKIISYYLKDKKVSDDIDVEEIARFSEGHSCAALEAVVNEAGIMAAYENREFISQDDFKTASLRIIHDISGKWDTIPDESIRRVAVHEAGHAVMIEHFDPGNVNFITVGGMVSEKFDPHSNESFVKQENQIMISLAGKAATELILNEIDMGTNKDLHMAYDQLRALIDNVASYDFNSWCHGDETSSLIYDHLDAVTGGEMARYYMKTKRILSENKAFLEELINQLIEKKTLSYKDIAKIKEEMKKR